MFMRPPPDRRESILMWSVNIGIHSATAHSSDISSSHGSTPSSGTPLSKKPPKWRHIKYGYILAFTLKTTKILLWLISYVCYVSFFISLLPDISCQGNIHLIVFEKTLNFTFWFSEACRRNIYSTFFVVLEFRLSLRKTSPPIIFVQLSQKRTDSNSFLYTESWRHWHWFLYTCEHVRWAFIQWAYVRTPTKEAYTIWKEMLFCVTTAV